MQARLAAVCSACMPDLMARCRTRPLRWDKESPAGHEQRAQWAQLLLAHGVSEAGGILLAPSDSCSVDDRSTGRC
jgi:hypothetical protein